MKHFLLIIGLLLLFGAEIVRVYFIMPFPGSQQSDTIRIAYFLNKYILYIRLAALLLIIFATYNSFLYWRNWQKGILLFLLLLYTGIFYLVNFKFMADKMFYQPHTKNLALIAANKVSSDKLVIGVTINNESKAYPIGIIGYHHQVQDTVSGEAIIVTYCTVCRTGRIFSPFVNGKKESFRLAGMDHFNAVFEDATTKSWWQQATGIAIAGPLKGQSLKEIPSQQMRLSAWLRSNPNSLVLQPDPSFKKEYEELTGYDKGLVKSGLEKRDTGSWKFKSWVLGIQQNHVSKAYDWNKLIAEKIIIDSLPLLPFVLTVEPDSSSFHAWNRTINNQVLGFMVDSNGLKDSKTGSVWNFDGLCIEGPLKGQHLVPVPVSQEFWHSWQSFHPGTLTVK